MAFLQEAVIDTYIVYKIISTLVKDWDEQDAYKLGIIDDKGKVLKKAKDLETSKEKAAYTVLIRFIFNLKRLLNKVPGGRSKFGSYAAAAILLLREEEENEKYKGLEHPDYYRNHLMPEESGGHVYGALEDYVIWYNKQKKS